MNRNMRDRVEALEARLLPPPAARVFFIVIEDQSPLTSDEQLAAFRAESAVVVDALLALEPEELGARMLFLIARDPMRRRSISPLCEVSCGRSLWRPSHPLQRITLAASSSTVKMTLGAARRRARVSGVR